MSKTKISIVWRRAIWEAHNRQSAYDGEPIEWDDLHVDHIIPEDALGTGEFQRIRHTLHLSDNFDINGPENLLPAKSGQNRRKGKWVFNEANVRFFLELASRKYDKVIQLEHQFKRKAKQDSIILVVATALEEGTISADEVRYVLDQIQRPDQAFQLLSEIYAGDDSVITRILKSEVDDLRDIPLLDTEEFLPLHVGPASFGDEPHVHVRTVREYENAIRHGASPLTTVAIKIASRFEQISDLLRLLEHASPPSRNLLSELRSGVSDLDRLPVAAITALEFGEMNLFDENGASEGEVVEGPTPVEAELIGFRLPQKYFETPVSTLVSKGHIVIKSVGAGSIVLEMPEMQGLILTELVRSDFNGDGYEDVLVTYYSYAIGGSLGFGGTLVLTLRKVEGLLEIVEIGGASASMTDNDQ
jgi:hypothetical protein